MLLQLAVALQRCQLALQSEHETGTKLLACEADNELLRVDCSRSRTACSNLQRVLEQFQVEKDHEIASSCAQIEDKLRAAEESHVVQVYKYLSTNIF